MATSASGDKSKETSESRNSGDSAKQEHDMSQYNEDDLIIYQVLSWTKKIVVGLKLCPFADNELEKNKVRVALLPKTAENFDDFRAFLFNEIQNMMDTDPKLLSTTLVVAPKGSFLDDLPFVEFSDFHADIEEEIDDDEYLVDEVMIVPFHPQYQWAETEKDDPINFDRRSPYPMINILRAEDVDYYAEKGMTQDILTNNEKTLTKVGSDKLLELYKSIRPEYNW
eukprot:CAMPEP_0184696610 /NCGR_PEP_ID=MMETSP0313-20130426/3843_1 /TAXON_ID=2792 /ORGANISM="Porphyridium aerugineum, Strain SAG 1380-2" /LENGTH=224 /DNA_ID=CAMNT_0027155267 /DNA_START=27 /DNA_END=701 /DNA_ORIENTATION=-